MTQSFDNRIKQLDSEIHNASMGHPDKWMMKVLLHAPSLINDLLKELHELREQNDFLCERCTPFLTKPLSLYNAVNSQGRRVWFEDLRDKSLSRYINSFNVALHDVNLYGSYWRVWLLKPE